MAWQLAITILQRLLVSVNDINQLPRLCDIQNGRYSSVNFGAKVSTMVARAWPVSVECDSGLAACCPESNEPTSCFYDTSILRYPFDLFQWKSMGRVAKVL